MSDEKPFFTADDFIFENNYGNAVGIIAKASAEIANAKVAPLIKDLEALRGYNEDYRRAAKKTESQWQREAVELAADNSIYRLEIERLRAALEWLGQRHFLGCAYFEGKAPIEGCTCSDSRRARATLEGK